MKHFWKKLNTPRWTPIGVSAYGALILAFEAGYRQDHIQAFILCAYAALIMSYRSLYVGEKLQETK